MHIHNPKIYYIIYIILPQTSILLGGHTATAFEVFAEEGLAGEVQLVANLLHGHIG